MSARADRHYVTIEQEVRQGTGRGGSTVAWQPVVNCWASIQPLTGSQRVQYQQMYSEVSVVIRCLEVPTSMDSILASRPLRISSTDRVYPVEYSYRPGTLQRRLVCICKEG